MEFDLTRPFLTTREVLRGRFTDHRVLFSPLPAVIFNGEKASIEPMNKWQLKVSWEWDRARKTSYCSSTCVNTRGSLSARTACRGKWSGFDQLSEILVWFLRPNFSNGSVLAIITGIWTTLVKTNIHITESCPAWVQIAHWALPKLQNIWVKDQGNWQDPDNFGLGVK